MNGVWQRAADRIRESLGQVGYETWIGPLNFVGLEDRMATIEAPNRFFRDWVSDRYLDLMQQVLSAEIGENIEVKLILGKNGMPGKIVNGGSSGNGHTHQGVAVNGLSINPDCGGQAVPAAVHPHLNSRYTFAE